MKKPGLAILPEDDLRELLRFGLLWRAWAMDVREAGAPWAGDE